MTEKEKMLTGKCYNSRDPELLTQYHKARALLKAYNNLDSTKLEERKKILTTLFERVGNGVWIEAPFLCDYGGHISIGENTFINANCIFIDNNKIHIGANGLIGPHVQIYTAEHPIKASERIIKTEKGTTRYLTSTKPVIIGDNVWIGGNSVVFPGVTIGNNVTIGAGSVVTKSLPDNVLAFGNPCKIQKNL